MHICIDMTRVILHHSDMTEIARLHVIQFRVSEAEKAEIRRRASAIGLDMSEYVRVRALGEREGPSGVSVPVEPVPPKPSAAQVSASTGVPLAAEVERVYGNFRDPKRAK